ncbi:MAG: hypothetical protein Q4C66_05240 [Lachnospiraceae bacterium]|nr:hypothetical protein [Lachnospiraceae bacterium]
MEKNSQEINEKLVILNYIDPMHNVGSQIPFHVSSQCERPADEIITHLIEENLIAYAEIDQILLRETTASLKDFLKIHEDKRSGSKDILVRRIINNYDKDTILSYFSKRYYVLTTEGKKVLNSAHAIFNVPCISLAEYRRVFDKCLCSDYSDFKNEKHYLEFKEMRLGMLDDFKLYKKEIIAVTIASHILGVRTEHNGDICKYFFNHDIPLNYFYKTAKYLSGFISFKQLLESGESIPDGYEMKYIIKSVNDERVCDHCKKYNEKVYSYKDAILGVTFPPFDDCASDFCRCYVSTCLKKKI